MTAQTGNTYISGTMIDSIEITTATVGFSTMASSKKMRVYDHGATVFTKSLWSSGKQCVSALQVFAVVVPLTSQLTRRSNNC